MFVKNIWILNYLLYLLGSYATRVAVQPGHAEASAGQSTRAADDE